MNPSHEPIVLLNGQTIGMLMPEASPIVRFKKLHPDAVLPERASSGAACFDLTCLNDVYAPNGVVMVDTGIAIELPPGHVGLVCSRSGLAAKQGIFVLNSPGIIDEDYRGELKVLLARMPSNKEITSPLLKAGSRVAQLMVVQLPSISTEEAIDLTETERGANGFGSTGI